ncbi:hypothetical protein TNCT_309371 [Trichonephila clavata]|uniref:Uncharacterized protein n=1 Tax=Trichonephila clavata TaxID=2740835 RepID=A0A8X6HW07_TRICU|nr:hypothetical protein TNCT_309371 [Trichonephila clavata]
MKEWKRRRIVWRKQKVWGKRGRFPERKDGAQEAANIWQEVRSACAVNGWSLEAAGLVMTSCYYKARLGKRCLSTRMELFIYSEPSQRDDCIKESLPVKLSNYSHFFFLFFFKFQLCASYIQY